MAANNIHIPDDLLREMNAAAQAQGKMQTIWSSKRRAFINHVQVASAGRS